MERVKLTIRLPEDFLRAVRAFAESQTRSTSNLIEHALRTELKRRKAPLSLTASQYEGQKAQPQSD